jgi:hypothetical protein
MVTSTVLVKCVVGALAASLLVATSAWAQFSAYQTRLLFPFVTDQAGFDTGITVSNTGLDSTGQVGVAGKCTIHYFGQVAAGGPASAPAPQTTNAAIPPGGQLVFLLSSGGGFGITGAPNFQGYLEIVCGFPYAHGYGLVTDGPIGTARIGSSIPVLVLPNLFRPFPETTGH